MPTPFLNQRDPRDELARLLAQQNAPNQMAGAPADLQGLLGAPTPTLDAAAQQAQSDPGLDMELANRGLASPGGAGMTPAEDYLGTPAQLEVIEQLKRAQARRHPPNPGVGTPSMDLPAFGGIR